MNFFTYRDAVIGRKRSTVNQVKKVPDFLVHKINLYLQPRELCRWLQSCHQIYDLFHSQEYQLRWIHTHPLGRRFTAAQNEHYHDLTEKVIIEKPHVHMDDNPEYTVTLTPNMGEMEGLLIYLKHQEDGARVEALQEAMLVKGNRLALAMTELYRNTSRYTIDHVIGHLEKAISLGEYRLAPYHLAGELLHKYHQSVGRHPEESSPNTMLKRIYGLYRLSMLYGNLDAYHGLFQLIRDTPLREDLMDDLPRYEHQVLIRGGRCRHCIGVGPFTTNVDVSTLEKWTVKIDEAVKWYLVIKNYCPAWMPLVGSDSYQDRINCPSYGDYLIHVLWKGHADLGSLVIDVLRSPKYRAHWTVIPEILQFLLQVCQESQIGATKLLPTGSYMEYCIELLRCPRPDDLNSRSKFISKYLPSLQDMLLTEEGNRYFLNIIN